MKYFEITLRLLWGLHYFVFGINKLFIFQEVPAGNPFAQQVLDGFYNTGYLMQSVGIAELLTGLFIIVNRCFPLAALAAFPITLNIALYTIFTSNYTPSAIFAGGLVFFANLYFLVKNREKYLPLLQNTK